MTEANVNAFDEDGDTCLHLLLNDKLATSEITGINAKQASPNSIEQKDLKDCKQLLMVIAYFSLIFNDSKKIFKKIIPLSFDPTFYS